MLSAMEWDFHHIPKALDECKEFGKHLREMPLIVGKALRIGPQQGRAQCGRASEPMLN